MSQNSPYRNFSYLSVARFGAIALQAVFYLLFAAILEPELYGELNYFIAIAGTTALLSRFGLSQTVTVFRAKENSKLADQVNTLAIISSSVAAIILISFDLFTALLALAISFFVMNQGNLLGFRNYKKYAIFTILKNVLIIALPLALYFVLDIPGIILGMAIANFVASAPFFKILKIKSIVKLKKSAKVIIHNFGVDASTNLSRLVDKLLVAPLLGFFVLGIFQFNMQILFALEIIPAILYAFLLSEESSGASHKKIIYLGLFASVILAILAMILAPFGVGEFFPKYYEGVLGLQVLVFSIIPLSISAILNAKLQARESTKIGYSAVVRIGSLLILIALLGELYGFVGLSVAVLMSVIINTVFLFFLYKKKSNHTNLNSSQK